jgi:hypothetical protein
LDLKSAVKGPRYEIVAAETITSPKIFTYACDIDA